MILDFKHFFILSTHDCTMIEFSFSFQLIKKRKEKEFFLRRDGSVWSERM
jgi:hypothetical protein